MPYGISAAWRGSSDSWARGISHLPQQANSLPRSKPHVNGPKHGLPTSHPRSTQTPKPTLMFTAPVVARKALREVPHRFAASRGLVNGLAISSGSHGRAASRRLGSLADLTFRSNAFVRLVQAFYAILELAVSLRQLPFHLVRPWHRIAVVPRVGFESYGLAYLEFMHGAAPVHNRREHCRTLSHRRLRSDPWPVIT
jgi:hypothetical protein